MKKNIFYPYTAENIHPAFSIDCVILSFHKNKLQVLLNKFDISQYWQLPGGFMFNEENSDDAATRILTMRTGLTDIYLKQFYLFTDTKRTIIEQNLEYLEKGGDEEETAKNWILQRFISLGYYALVKYESVKLSKSENDQAKWFDFNNLPPLYSDHKNIIETSFNTICSMLPILPVGCELLPEKFTMTELRKIYEIFTGKILDRRNFQRKILASGAIIQLDETKGKSSYNPPILYSFSKTKKIMIDYSMFL